MNVERLLASDVGALRREIVLGIPPGDEVTVSLPPEQMSMLIYALGHVALSESICRVAGHEEIWDAVTRTSNLMLSADIAPYLDKFLDEVTKGDEDAA